MSEVDPNQLSINFDNSVESELDSKSLPNGQLYILDGFDKPNVAVSLDERAKLLLQTLDNFADVAKTDGHISGIVDNHPRFRGKYRDPDAVIESLARKKRNFEYASDLVLHQALGYKALKTIFDEEKVIKDETEDIDSFHKKIIGPKNKYNRDKLRAKLREGVELRSELKSKQDS